MGPVEQRSLVMASSAIFVKSIATTFLVLVLALVVAASVTTASVALVTTASVALVTTASVARGAAVGS